AYRSTSRSSKEVPLLALLAELLAAILVDHFRPSFILACVCRGGIAFAVAISSLHNQRRGQMAISHALVGLSSIAVLLTAANVQAQSMPPEGPVSVTFTATPIPPPKPMPIGGGREFDLLNQAMAATNDTGNPVLNNMGGRCQFSRIRDTSTKTVQLNGFCTYV